MRNFFILFASTFALISVWILRDDVRGLLFVIAMYSVAIYWALGYQWSSGIVSHTKGIVALRKSLLLIAFIFVNILSIKKLLYGDLAEKLYVMVSFLVLTGVLYIHWKKTEWMAQSKETDID